MKLPISNVCDICGLRKGGSQSNHDKCAITRKKLGLVKAENKKPRGKISAKRLDYLVKAYS